MEVAVLYPCRDGVRHPEIAVGVHLDVIESIEWLLEKVVNNCVGVKGDWVDLNDAGIGSFAAVRCHIDVTSMVHAAMHVHCWWIRGEVLELQCLSFEQILPRMTRRPCGVEQLLGSRDVTRRFLRLFTIRSDYLLDSGVWSDYVEESLVKSDKISRT